MKRREVFETLEAPPGGLALLREKLAPARPVRRPVLAWVVPAAAAAGLAVLLARPEPAGHALIARLQGDPAAAALGLVQLEAPVVVPAGESGRTAVRRLESRDPQIVMYLVESVD